MKILRHPFLMAGLAIGGLLTACACRVHNQPIDPRTFDRPVRVACVGDSLTAGRESWPAHLDAHLGDRWEIRNFGLGESTVLQVGDTPYLTLKLPEVLAYQPDAVVVLLGTNDSKPRHWYYWKDFVKDYRRLLRELEALPSRPRIWVCLPPPAFPGQWGIHEERLQEMRPLIRRVARRHGVPVIDLQAPFADRPERFPDQIHPDPEASREIADIIRQAVVGPSAGDGGT